MKRISIITAGAAALALTLAGCGGSGDAPEESEGGLRTVNVVGVPVVDMAALYVGENQGFFEDEGLELNIEFGQGTAAMIPALLNGQYDVQYGGSINLLQAIDAGMPLQAIAVGGRTTGVQGEDHGALLVSEDSDIQSPKDLEGRTIAVNALHGLHEVALWQSVTKDGGDPEKVTFVEMALPDMGAALENGEVDAVSTAEPFLGLLLDEGTRQVTSPYADVDENFATALYFGSDEAIAEDSDLYESFVSALEKSFAYSSEHSDEVRAELGNFTQIDPDAAETMILTDFTWGLSYDDLLIVAEAGADADTIDDPEGTAKKAATYVDPQ
ncbi:ABC transporter substrate-binding protein [Microbacterium halotolerans]|uniref:ABC transporter substrate-binding protein n=1 Tax=Microbacterium halotolerans TaxID=246613 RepID=UPI000E6AB392|nr:ABC transporter substrate-binding protein [Microbacterium halotolerans]